MILLLYSPFLIFLPILLLGGIIFVVVPGGFIIVLAGAWYLASAGLIGLVGLATTRRRPAIHANPQGSAASSARLRPTTQTPSKRPGAGDFVGRLELLPHLRGAPQEHQGGVRVPVGELDGSVGVEQHRVQPPQ